MCLGSLFDCFYMSVSSQMVVCLSFLLFCFVCLWKCLWFWNLSALTFSADIDPTEKKAVRRWMWHLFLREQHLWPLRVDDVPTELHGTGYAYSPLLTLEAAIPANGVLFILFFFYQEEIKMLYVCLQMPIKPNQSAVSCGLLPLFISKNKKFDLRFKS